MAASLVDGDQAVAAGGPGVVEPAVQLRIGHSGHVQVSELGEDPVVLRVDAGVEAGPAGEVETVEAFLGAVRSRS